MSLLSEEDRNQLEDDLEQQIGKNAFDAIESAILAKLASAELPEPELMPMLVIGLNHSSENVGERSFTEAEFYSAACEIFKLGQAKAYAQGAAAQLAQEPSGFIDRYGEIFAEAEQMLSTDTPLYTRREA